MTLSLSKIAFRTGLATAGILLAFQASDLLLSYHYFRFEYYISGAVIIALISGIMLSRKYYREQLPGINVHNPLDDLTAKELQVLELIAAGKSNKEIASLNYIEISTVKTHINNIFFKLGVKKRAAAAKVYVQLQNTQKSTFFPPVTI